jgi:hypothetical protein
MGREKTMNNLPEKQKQYIYDLLIDNINYEDIIDKLKYVNLIYQIDRMHKSFDTIISEKYQVIDTINDLIPFCSLYDYYYCGFIDIDFNFKEIIQNKLKRVGFAELNNLVDGIYEMMQYANSESMTFPVYTQYPEHNEKFYNYLGNMYAQLIHSLIPKSIFIAGSPILRISLKELFHLSKINDKENELKDNIIKNVKEQITYYKLYDNQQLKNDTEFYLLNEYSNIFYFKNISYKSLYYILPYCNCHFIINDRKKEISNDDFLFPQLTNIKDEDEKKYVSNIYKKIYEFISDNYNTLKEKLEMDNKKLTIYQRDIELLHLLAMKIDFYCKINYDNIENIIRYENNRYLPTDVLMLASYLRKKF